jgi:ribosome biogenesis GTPase A
VRAIALDAGEAAPARRLIAGCRELAPGRKGLAKPMRVLICGIPNVGKSTLINTLVGKRAAKTGDEAGITRMAHRIVLEDDFYLWDTPGVLWPRIRLPQSGVRLAASGAIGRNAYDEQEVALDLLACLVAAYPQALRERYKVELPEGVRDEQVLEDIARRRGAFAGKGRPDLHKAAEILIHEFRAGILGRLTLETPEEFAAWEAQAQQRDAERQAKKDAIAAQRKQRASRPRVA